MRWALVALIWCGIAGAQQQPSLIQFLALTTAETASVRQVNDAFMQFSNLKNQRLNAIQNDLSAEYAKASSDPYALGVRYIKIDSIIHELAGEQTNFQAKVTALLTPAQMALVQQIAKPAPDSLALGVRYAELGEIQQELTTADKDARTAARNLLTSAQQAKLKFLTDTAALATYQFSAEGCHFFSVPPGTAADFDFSRFGCALN